MNQDLWWQFTRYLLQIVGTALVMRGVLTKEIGALLYSEAAIGALMTLGSIVWGFYVKWRTKAVPIAVVAAEQLPTVSSMSGRMEAPPPPTAPLPWKSKE